MSSDEEIEFVEETRKRKVQRGNVKNSKNEKDSKKEKKAKVMDRDEIVRDPKYWDKFDAFVERILGKWDIFTMDDSYTRDEIGKLTFAPRGRNSLKISFDINNHSGTQTNFLSVYFTILRRGHRTMSFEQSFWTCSPIEMEIHGS